VVRVPPVPVTYQASLDARKTAAWDFGDRRITKSVDFPKARFRRVNDLGERAEFCESDAGGSILRHHGCGYPTRCARGRRLSSSLIVIATEGLRNRT
jgi:hypothetical protein